LCERIGQPSQLFAIMWGAWIWHLVRADLRLCMELASEALALAERVNDPGMLMEALFLPAVTLVFRGEFATARAHCARALAQYDDRHRTRFWADITGEDSGVAHRCYLSVALWHLGQPDQALKLNHEAVGLARAIGHPFTLAFALEHRAWLHNQCRLAAEARAAAEEEIAIATEQGFSYWLASATLFKADSLVLQGQWSEALPLLLKGLHDLRATGTGLDLTFHLGFLGAACTRAGRFEDAMKALNEGLAVAEKSDERFYEAELHRLKGELQAESPDKAAAEESFRKAIATARRQQSKAWELRATTSLARLWQQQSRREEARLTLAAVYGTYTEGFTTPDLVDAAALFETLEIERNG
jgi:predicted ATPase